MEIYKINHICINQLYNQFSLSYNKGILIFDLNTFDIISSSNTSDFSLGEVLISSILSDNKYLVFTGSSNNKQYHNKKLNIWDKNIRKVICSTHFKDNLLNLKSTKNLIFASTNDEINICYYNQDYNMIEVRHKLFNTSNIFEIWFDINYFLCTLQDNNINIVKINEDNFEYRNILYCKNKLNGVQNIFYDNKSNLLFVVDKDGINIDVYSISSNYILISLVSQMYRGKNPSNISSITSIKSKYAIVSNSNKTIHIFDMMIGSNQGSYITNFFNLMVNPFSLNRSILAIRLNDICNKDDFYNLYYKNKGNILLFNDETSELKCITYNGKILIFKIDLDKMKYYLVNEYNWCDYSDQLKESRYTSENYDLDFSYYYKEHKNSETWRLI